MTPLDEFTREDRLFVFASPDNNTGLAFDYLTGHAPDGRQVLAGIYVGEEPYVPGTAPLQLVWFDAAGQFLATETVRPPLDTEPLPPPLTAESFRGDRTVRGYLAALGVQLGTIRVRHFCLYPNEEDDLSDPRYAPFPIGISLLRPRDPEYIWNPYGIAGTSLADALRITDYATGGIPFGDFFLCWGEKRFSAGGHRPDDHRDRKAPYPLQVVPDRLYTLRTFGPVDSRPDFVAGVMPDGRQGLMGCSDNWVVGLFFSPSGELLTTEERPTGFDMAQVSEEEPFQDVQHQTAQPVASAWRAELGWRDQLIKVRFFMHPNRPIFLSDLPSSGVTGYYDPFRYLDVTERNKARQEVRSWLADGNFVLNWMHEYHLSNNGEVLST